MYNGFLHKIVRNTGRICICFFFVKQGNRKKQELLVFTVHRLILLMLVVSHPLTQPLC